MLHEDNIDATPASRNIPVDTYVNMEIALPHRSDDALVDATVKKRALDGIGNPIGTYHKNPLLESRLYEVEYIDGTTENITANIIADNIMSQFYEEGKRQLILADIVDHRTDDNELKHES